MTPPAHSAYSFAHRLTLDASYRALLRHNRQALHSAAADALAASYVEGGPDKIGRLAALQHHPARTRPRLWM